jgi:hypothetical protein
MEILFDCMLIDHIKNSKPTILISKKNFARKKVIIKLSNEFYS